MIKTMSRTIVDPGSENRNPSVTRVRRISGVCETAFGLLAVYTGYRLVKYAFDKKKNKNVDDYIIETE